jgi:hypothetical protein
MNDLSQRPRTDDTAWSELEQAFFAAAPPDDPEPAAEPMRFDDDTTAVAAARGRAWTGYLQTLSVVRSATARLFAAIDVRRLDTKVMAAALAATVLVTALSTRAPSLAGGAGGCSDACLSPSDPTLVAFECASDVDLETDLRSQYCCL